ncbi:MATE family efflux transporter [Acetoanaerobium noterae]|uniref:MATE family efflux transporter n=1 Tax=Acetoanaerobium noterae TaxID=745369 RepID=UPI0028A940D6|nr:MATE family efflux transporter [Acetoanaerobium noterae]
MKTDIALKDKSILKNFTKYSLSNVLGMVGLSCYILADTFFIANGVGADGLAALNLAIPIYSFIHGCGLMLGIGGVTKYSIYKSQNSEYKANSIFTNTIYLALLISLLFMALGYFYSEGIAYILGADSKIFAMTNTYLKVMLLFTPLFIVNEILICFVRNDSKPRLSMTAMLVGSLSNIILDYIFIFEFKMGMLGAVLATGVSPIISMIVISVHFIKKNNSFYLVKVKLKLSKIKTIFSLGLPSLITELSAGVVMIVFNLIILRLEGNTGVAAYGVIANIALVVNAMFVGIAQGIQPLVTKAYGKGEKEVINKTLKYALITMLGLAAVIYITTATFADSITLMFNSEGNPKLQEIAITGLRLYFTSGIFAGFNIIISMYFTSTDNPAPAQLISLIRGFFLIIPLAFILSRAFGIIGVWITFPLTEAMVAVAVALFLTKKLQTTKTKL